MLQDYNHFDEMAGYAEPPHTVMMLRIRVQRPR
jgi:hypothetical protein